MSGSGVSADQHKLFLSHQLFNKKTIDIPPRKLLTRRPNSLDCSGSPKAHPLPPSFDTLFQKFLPFNGGDDDDSDPYSSDHFRMFEFKVRRCTRSRSHDWTDCPFSHPGEKARRRDPRRYHYSGTVCSDYRRGGCSRGDNCEFAHGVFECWLHPARYRTEPCKDGKNCKRKVCFFAHSRKQLRVLPSHSQTNGNHCCVFCRSATSPTSTLMGMPHFSPPESPSPPLSPVNLKPPYSSLSRYNDIRSSTSTGLDSSNMSKFRHVMLSCCNKDVVAGLIMSSLEAININEASGSESTTSWVDACFADEVEDHDYHQHFILSPSTPKATSASRHFFNGLIEDKISSENKNWDCPDLGWVNDLLM